MLKTSRTVALARRLASTVPHRRGPFVRNSSTGHTGAAAKTTEPVTDPPLFETGTKVKMAFAAVAATSFFAYNKLNDDPVLRASLDEAAPGLMKVVRGVVKIDSVKLEDTQTITVWDHAEAIGAGYDENMPGQLAIITTRLNPHNKFHIQAGPTDTVSVLKQRCISKGMSMDDDVIDVTLLSNSAELSESAVAQTIAEEDPEGDLLNTLQQLRQEEAQLRAQMDKWKRLPGGATKVQCLLVDIEALEAKKMQIKSFLKKK